MRRLRSWSGSPRSRARESIAKSTFIRKTHMIWKTFFRVFAERSPTPYFYNEFLASRWPCFRIFGFQTELSICGLGLTLISHKCYENAVVDRRPPTADPPTADRPRRPPTAPDDPPTRPRVAPALYKQTPDQPPLAAVMLYHISYIIYSISHIEHIV